MKHIFYETAVIFVLLLFPSTVRAQKIELSAAAGITTNTLPAINDNFSGDKAALGLAASIKVKYRAQRRLSIGLGIDMQELRTVSELKYANPEPGVSQKVYNIGVPAINFYATAERHLWLRSLEITGGVQVGGTLASNSSVGADRINYPRSTGYMVGLVIGAGVRLSRHFSVRTELAPRYHALFFGNLWHGVHDISVLSFPLTLGVSFRM